MSTLFDSAFDILDKRTPGSPAQIRALREDVFSIGRKVKRHMDNGLAPDEIGAARGLLAAAEVAEEIVNSLAA
jgi:hypothetical protein